MKDNAIKHRYDQGGTVSGPEPSFSIILPTYNRSSVVEETLRRLIDQDYPPDQYEILVCDNPGEPEVPRNGDNIGLALGGQQGIAALLAAISG